MEVKVKIDETYMEPEVVIYTKEMNEEINKIRESILNCNQNKIKVYKEKTMYIFNQEEIETVYSESSKVWIRVNNELYIVKNRLYELEEMLDEKKFCRISNSEIANFDKVLNIDFKIIGTLILNFKSGNKSYVSRRYIQKIKEFLEI